MANELKVGISEYVVSKSPDKLITIGLGSCVGIAVYDRRTKVGGLSHIMLPDSKFFNKGNLKPEKFADLAIPKMVRDITDGKFRRNLAAKIAGGASMFNFPDKKLNNNIGERNVLAVEEVLKKLGIPILAKDTGGTEGRTMIVDLESFTVTVRTASRKIITL